MRAVGELFRVVKRGGTLLVMAPTDGPRTGWART